MSKRLEYAKRWMETKDDADIDPLEVMFSDGEGEEYDEIDALAAIEALDDTELEKEILSESEYSAYIAPLDNTVFSGTSKAEEVNPDTEFVFIKRRGPSFYNCIFCAEKQLLSWEQVEKHIDSKDHLKNFLKIAKENDLDEDIVKELEQKLAKFTDSKKEKRKRQRAMRKKRRKSEKADKKQATQESEDSKNPDT
ncbi:hypothetical protein PCE1_001521 [Barthelona sp. PCE]